MKKKRIALFLCAAAVVVALLPGCGSGIKVDHTMDFVTVAYKSTDGKHEGDVCLGITADQLYAITNTAVGNFSGIWPKYNAAGAMVSMKIDGIECTTKYGTNVNSNYTDLIPAYAKDPDVTVELNTKEKVIFAKTINGVKYTVTYRNLPNSGSVMSITFTNTAEYTENDADYQ